MRVSLITLSIALGIPLLTQHAAAQTPEGLLKQDAASKGETSVAGKGFEAGEKPPEELKDATNFTVSAGGFFSAGNTRNEAITSATQFRLRRGANQASAAGAANFARTAQADRGLETTVQNFQGKVRYDRFLSGKLAAFLGSSQRIDRFQGFVLRLNVDPGLAYYFIDRESHQFWGEFGYDLQHDIRTDAAIVKALAENGTVVDKTATRHSTRAFVGYDNKLNETVAFNMGVEYIQSFQQTKNWRLNWDWALTSTLADRLAAATTFTLRYDNNPLPSVHTLDVITSVSLVVTLM